MKVSIGINSPGPETNAETRKVTKLRQHQASLSGTTKTEIFAMPVINQRFEYIAQHKI
jgi:hypothetical protein